MEVRALTNISMYEFYTSNENPSMRVSRQNVERVAKLNVILTNELIPQFKNTNEYVHLLTLLIQSNLWNIKTADKTFHKKSIITDLAMVLFLAQNFYKAQLSSETFLTRT